VVHLKGFSPWVDFIEVEFNGSLGSTPSKKYYSLLFSRYFWNLKGCVMCSYIYVKKRWISMLFYETHHGTILTFNYENVCWCTLK
jgi:hypothetical protein